DTSAVLFAEVLSPENLLTIGAQFLLVFAAALVGAVLLGKPLKPLSIVFPFIFVLTLFALIIAGNNTVREYNLEAVIFSLGIGLLISNFFILTSLLRDAIFQELYLKIGLVLLGTMVIFSEILKTGGNGLIQNLLVVLFVWYIAF